MFQVYDSKRCCSCVLSNILIPSLGGDTGNCQGTCGTASLQLLDELKIPQMSKQTGERLLCGGRQTDSGACLLGAYKDLYVYTHIYGINVYTCMYVYVYATCIYTHIRKDSCRF